MNIDLGESVSELVVRENDDFMKLAYDFCEGIK